MMALAEQKHLPKLNEPATTLRSRRWMASGGVVGWLAEEALVVFVLIIVGGPCSLRLLVP